MSHREQRRFCKSVKRKYPSFFCRSNVIDVGSLDGNNRYLFRNCGYIGVDLIEGKNVDRIGMTKDVLRDLQDTYEYHYHGLVVVDTVISTEMLEHDATWNESLNAMYDILRPGGLLLITAGEGRPEHGAYYCNISNQMFASVLPASLFTTYYLNQDPRKCDLQFYGIKKNLRC
jgi:SAM-dependent methyltransferase